MNETSDSTAALNALRLKESALNATATYTRVARQFLDWRFKKSGVCLPDLLPVDSIAFVRHESKRMAPPAVKCAAKALRSFLRFAEFSGEVRAGLSAGVPSVATWTTTPPIPKAILSDHAQLAIDSCDRLTAIGRRDRAVLLLLARLGLRACEVIRLTLDDIDSQDRHLMGKNFYVATFHHFSIFDSVLKPNQPSDPKAKSPPVCACRHRERAGRGRPYPSAGRPGR